MVRKPTAPAGRDRVLTPDASGLTFAIRFSALGKMFERLCVRAQVDDFRFHDLRHTAATRLDEKLPNVIELAAVTGHRSIRRQIPRACLVTESTVRLQQEWRWRLHPDSTRQSVSEFKLAPPQNQ